MFQRRSVQRHGGTSSPVSRLPLGSAVSSSMAPSSPPSGMPRHAHTHAHMHPRTHARQCEMSPHELETSSKSFSTSSRESCPVSGHVKSTKRPPVAVNTPYTRKVPATPNADSMGGVMTARRVFVNHRPAVARPVEPTSTRGLHPHPLVRTQHTATLAF